MTNVSKAPAEAAGVLPMSGAELRCLRECLGLTTRWLAQHLSVAERSVHRWEAETQRIPEGVADEVQRLSALTYDALKGLAYKMYDLPECGVITTYRSDGDYRAHEPESDWPASWHRALCARLADEVPGLRIRYWSESLPNHLQCPTT